MGEGLCAMCFGVVGYEVLAGVLWAMGLWAVRWDVVGCAFMGCGGAGGQERYGIRDTRCADVICWGPSDRCTSTILASRAFVWFWILLGLCCVENGARAKDRTKKRESSQSLESSCLGKQRKKLKGGSGN